MTKKPKQEDATTSANVGSFPQPIGRPLRPLTWEVIDLHKKKETK